MATVFSFLYVLLLFLQRPAALGQMYAAHGLAAIIVVTACYFVWSGLKIRAPAERRRDMAVLCVLVSAYLIYEIIIAIAFGMTKMGLFAKEVVLTLAMVVCYGTFLLDPRNNERFFRQLTTVISLLGWSSAITLAALFFVDPLALKLFDLQIKGYESDNEVQTGAIYLPLSMAYMSIGIFEIPLMRFTGFFREPGIYQAVAAYCYVLASIAGRGKLIRLGLAVGIISAFSTIGIAMLVVAIGVAFFLTHRVTFTRLTVTLLIFAASVIALIYAPVIGLLDKADTAEISVTDRTQATVNGIHRLGDNPLGYGPFSGKDANQDINLTAAAGSLGMLGFLLQVLLLSGFRWPAMTTRMGACAPLLITALTSQPIATAAMMYVLVMVWPTNKA